MGALDLRAARMALPAVLLGIAGGLLVFVRAPRPALRMIVGLVVGGVAVHQLVRIARRRAGCRPEADLVVLRRCRWRSFLAGGCSACTGTGVAELHQPMFEHDGGLATRKANATAILVEALADWAITLANLSLGNVRFDILAFSASGVLIGAQVGAAVSARLPDRLLKTVFALCVLVISAVYIVTSLPVLIARTGSVESG
jgi:uncharacterized membrane protein YfcA